MRITGQAPCRDLTWLAERVAQGLYESMAGEARGVWVVHGAWVLARAGDALAPPAILQQGRRVVYRDAWMFVGEQVPGQPFLVVVALPTWCGGLSLMAVGKLHTAATILASMLAG